MTSGEKGRFGENEACRYLAANGYEILARNYRSRYGEIDLIAQHNGTVVFVEVKLRRDRAFADAAQAVGPSKQEKLRKTALLLSLIHIWPQFGHLTRPGISSFQCELRRLSLLVFDTLLLGSAMYDTSLANHQKGFFRDIYPVKQDQTLFSAPE